jgi:CobQ-like glutamine amidotransferase family enzyme
VSTDPTPVRILQLYPDELGVTGDAGNVAVLRRRLERSDVPTELVLYSPGADLPAAADLVVIGNGPLSAIRRIHADLLTKRAELVALLNRTPVFAVGAGLEVLCQSIETPEGALEGLGVISAVAHRGRPRRVGYVVGESQYGPIVGFEDQATELSGAETPFVTIVQDVTGTVSRTDGVEIGAIVGTLLQGPLLPLNPGLADRLAAAAAVHAGVDYVPDGGLQDVDRLAERARERMRANIGMHFTTIQ